MDRVPLAKSCAALKHAYCKQLGTRRREKVDAEIARHRRVGRGPVAGQDVEPPGGIDEVHQRGARDNRAGSKVVGGQAAAQQEFRQACRFNGEKRAIKQGKTLLQNFPELNWR